VSDAFYFCLRSLGYPIVWISSRPTVLHGDRVPRRGAAIVAANHLSPYDIPCLMYASSRPLDFISVTEVFENRFTGWLYGSMNAFPLDRHRPDVPTVRTALHRLERGRALAMFPEGGIRNPQTSLLNGGAFKPGVAGIARLSAAPVVPCVIVGTRSFTRPTVWLPWRRGRWGANFGEPLTFRHDLPEAEATDVLLTSLRAAYTLLYDELRAAMGGDVLTAAPATPGNSHIS
jgi:1-acyl-sn-glycerol-3-phosphate acyltransferase